MFDPHFSENSYVLRPGRSAEQAVHKAREYQHEGKRWVVDLYLEKLPDLVNHDILMQCLRKRVQDPFLLKLIGRYLEAERIECGGNPTPTGRRLTAADLTTVDALLNQSAATDYRLRDLVTRIATSQFLTTR